MITTLKIKGSIPEIDSIEEMLSEFSLEEIKANNTKVKCHYGKIEGIKNIPLSKSLYAVNRISEMQLDIRFKVNCEVLSFDLDLLGAITSFQPGVIVNVEGYDEDSFKYFRFDAYNGLVTNIAYLMDDRDFCRRLAELTISLGLYKKDCSSFLLSSSLRVSVLSSSKKQCILTNSATSEIEFEIRTSTGGFIASLNMVVADKGELLSLYQTNPIVNFDVDTVRMLT